MQQYRSAIFVLITALIAPLTLDAQSVRSMRRDRNRTKAIFLHDFRQALPKFDAAVKLLETSLNSKPANFAKPAQEIQKQTDVFLRYLKFVNEEHPSFKPDGLEKYSTDELGWETLTAAENLVPVLPKVVEAERSTVVNLHLWQFLYVLEGELQRLKWMSSRLK